MKLQLTLSALSATLTEGDKVLASYSVNEIIVNVDVDTLVPAIAELLTNLPDSE